MSKNGNISKGDVSGQGGNVSVAEDVGFVVDWQQGQYHGHSTSPSAMRHAFMRKASSTQNEPQAALSQT